MSFETIFFFIISTLAVGSAILMISQRNPILSVLWLIVNFFCLAILYLFLQAQFIAIIQILVYAGAIMVLVLFVIMLLNLGDEEQFTEKVNYKQIIALALAGIVFFQIMLGIGYSTGPDWFFKSNNARQIGTVEAIGKVLFSEFLLPFEITSLILLAAIVGVIVLAKRRLD
ncbi:MAG: NADH-quinone oxidoreductase subunit J [Ignavibacteriales bacterium]|nr:NADH-quinone oxidoreductase subunit J [Ignavibacteriales bacterium]